MRKFRSLLIGLGVLLLAVPVTTAQVGAKELNDVGEEFPADEVTVQEPELADGLVDELLYAEDEAEELTDEPQYENEDQTYVFLPAEDQTAGIMLDNYVQNEKSTDTGETSGTFENGIHWEITGSGKALTLTFTGSGPLPTINYNSPWEDRKTSISKVVIGNGITEISNSAFFYFTELRTVELPGTLKKIGQSAFSNCADLTSVEIPASVEEIGSNAFIACAQLKVLSFAEGSSLGLIGSNAFSNTGIVSLNLPVTSGDLVIGSSAFYNSDVVNVTIPANVTEIDDDAFAASHIQTVTFAQGSRLKKFGTRVFYNSRLTELVLPETAETLEVGDQLCAFCSNLTSVTLSSTTTGSGYRWFDCCTALTNVSFPKSSNMTELGEMMFSGCSALDEVVIPSYVKKIGKSAFRSASLKNKVVIPASVEYIEAYAFQSSNLQSVTIPKAVTKINEYVFSSCNYLKSVTLSPAVETIEEGAFNFCISLRVINIPASVGIIGKSAFYGCSELEIVIVEKGGRLGFIEESAFSQCLKLKSIILTNSLVGVSDYAFYCNNSLKDVYYTGSQADWAKVVIEKYNEPLTGATMHYNFDYTNMPTIPDEPIPDPEPENAGILVVGQKVDLTGEKYFGQAYSSYKVKTKDASVSSKGILSAKKPAAAVIVTAYNGKGRSAVAVKSLTFTIEKPEVPKAKKTVTLTSRGETMSAADILTGTQVKPAGYVSSKPTVASVDPETGVVTALDKGTAKITILFGSADPKDKNAATYSFKVKVNIPVLNKKTATAVTGQKLTLKLKNVDKAKEVTWDSSTEAVTVVNGSVEVISWQEEPAVVSATVDGVSYSCSITIKKPELSKTEYTVRAGKKTGISFKNTKYKAAQASFTSSDPEIADVDASAGKIIGKKQGNCDITVTIGGVEYTAHVTVNP
ncbi:MAG: leucine-rich repeat protein [Lachnospiraceae bacterium]|nr:leucine-rich repeat protein [Lachnospiraceae bacterium]